MKIVLILLIVLIIIIIGFVLFSIQRQDQDKILNEITTNENTIKLIGTLKDVSGGEATGSVGVAIGTSSYRLFAQMENMSELGQGMHFEAWLISSKNDTVSFKSLGVVEKNGDKYNQTYSSNEDLTDYRFYTVTVEYIDNPNEPGEHVLDGILYPEEKPLSDENVITPTQ